MTENKNPIAQLSGYKKVLLFVGEPFHDALCAAHAVAQLIKNGGGEPSIYLERPLPAALSFLNITPFIAADINLNAHTSIIVSGSSLDMGGARLEKHNEYFKITLPKTIDKSAVRVENSPSGWDMVAGVGIKKEELAEKTRGARLEKNYEILIIGDAENRPLPYCEAVTRDLKEYAAQDLTPQIATSLLAGIIYRTQNFQSADLNPQTLFSAAYLISKGAAQQDIIRYLYKTKPLPLIKLWGRALTKFTYDDKTGVATSWITAADIEGAEAASSHAGMLLTELANNFAQAKVFILSVEKNSGEHVTLLHARDSVCRNSLYEAFNVRNKGAVAVFMLTGTGTLEQKTERLAQNIKKILQKKNGG